MCMEGKKIFVNNLMLFICLYENINQQGGDQVGVVCAERGKYFLRVSPSKYEAQTALFKDPVRTAL